MRFYDCTCDGYTQIYECTAFGGGFTIWKGSAFDCEQEQNLIRLHHAEYTGMSSPKAIRDCNDGAIIASSIGISNYNYYISIVNITVWLEMNNKTIECFHHNVQNQITSIGQEVLRITDLEGIQFLAALHMHKIGVGIKFCW